MKILIVDDDEVMLDVMSISLISMGYAEVACAPSGAAALGVLDDGSLPEVIFCDLNMPEMDGVELIRIWPGGSSAAA